MSDFVRSAFSMISSGISGATGESERGGELIGEVIEIGGLKLKVKKVLAEGGYGFVYVATDTNTGRDYAIKRQVVPSEKVKLVKQEISFLKQLKGHAHIIEFYGAAGIPPKQGAAELIFVTELVTGGSLVDIVNNQRLSPRQVLRVFHETCLAVAHMHSRQPPIIHRDLKVENLLLTKDRHIKLCDFGSATTNTVSPDHTWSATQRGLAEDEIQCNTTPMYRSPEMIDLYSNNPVNQKADIWALGCLLFKLCFQEHPFEDSAKLRILNANYHIPSDDQTYNMYHNLIRDCLVVEPQNRPAVDSIVAQLYIIADTLGEDLNGPHKEPINLLVPSSQSDGEFQRESSMGVTLQNTSQQAHKLFGMMRGGAENLYKNIKDTSNKVIASVQGTSRTRPLDISYITSRILVMSFPYEIPSHPHQNTIDEVGVYLEETHPSQYLVFNLSGEQYNTSKLNGQVVDYEWPFKTVPPLESLVELCRQMDSWLRAEPQNVLVIHCKDGVHPSLTLTVLYLLFLNALPTPQTAVRLFLARRLPEGQGMQISASEKRYMRYMSELVSPKPFKPHSRSVYILMLRLSTVPLYNENRNGCKPFLEIFIDGERVYTSCTKDSMHTMRNFSVSDGIVEIPVGVSVCGNLHVVVHHIKSVTPGVPGMGMSAVKMFHMQLHTGFIPLDASTVSFNRNELDGPAAKRAERFPEPFTVTLDLQVESTEQAGGSIAWQQLPHPQTHPITCFSTVQEQTETCELFGGKSKRPSQPKTTPINPDEGYAQLKNTEELAVADLLGGDSTHQTTPTNSQAKNDEVAVGDLLGGGSPSDTTPYIPYKDAGDDNDSESDSSSSSNYSSSSDDGRGKSVAHGKKEDQPGLLGGFFSNPAASEEAKLLEFGNDDNNRHVPSSVPMSNQQSDPFALWDTPTTTSGTTPIAQNDPFTMWETPTSTATPKDTNTSTSFDPFGVWDKSKDTSKPDPPKSSPQPVNIQFDPFAPNATPSTSQNSEPDLLGFGTSSSQLRPPSVYSNPGVMDQSKPLGNMARSGSWTSFGTTGGASGFSQPQKPNDPFGDIWSQANTSNISGTQRQKSADPLPGVGGFGMTRSPTHPQGPSPTHQPVMTSRPMYQPGNMGARPTSGNSGSSNNINDKSTSQRPNSSNEGGGTAKPRPKTPNESNPKPNKYGPVPGKQRGNQFDDLLDQNLFTNKSKEGNGSIPLNKLKAKNKIDKITDPDKAKVAEWAEGKEHNIRALIGSLHTILWEGEARWKQVGMHQLVEADQVSRYFRKACLSVHPDKAEKAHANLARAIFDELNDAYELFELSGAKSLYQM